ncbi:hypothetical protein ZWY2020_048314 [Hordeum vulgare]|nr:hypothetical protein ZWY2020_048314 [Hordeum vulgare]
MNTNVTICFLWQVIYFTDPVDEYLMQYLMEYGEEHAGAEPVRCEQAGIHAWINTRHPIIKELCDKVDQDNDVIYFTDPVDEYLMQYLMDYEDKITELVQGGPEARQGLEAQGHQGVVRYWWKKALDMEGIDSVKISNQLHNTPCMMATSKYG